MDKKTKSTNERKQCQSLKKNSRTFKLSVCVFLGENATKLYTVKGVNAEMAVKTFRKTVELIAGIPYSIQRLHYLDDGELNEDRRLGAYDIVPGAQLKLKLWLMWESLITAAIAGDIDMVFELGVTEDSNYEAPRISYLKNPADKRQCLAERAAVALFVAACHGHSDLCRKLVQSGANVNWKSPATKRSPLHVAAAMGQNHILGILLKNGADIKAIDSDGQTAISLANQFGHKACERQLVQFTWQQRATSSQPHSSPPPLFPHQRFDSALPANLVNGPEAQVYRPQLVPPGEFGGTGLDAPRRKVKSPGVRSGQSSLSRATSAPSNAASAPYIFYDYQSPSDWLAMAGDDGELGDVSTDNPKTDSATTTMQQQQQQQQQLQLLQQQQQRRRLATENDDLIAVVINRKMHEQQERNLGGLPYDLWLKFSERPELFQAIKDRGRLDAVLPAD
jgi:hypothetical protein